jgi:hypothetical protein
MGTFRSRAFFLSQSEIARMAGASNRCGSIGRAGRGGPVLWSRSLCGDGVPGDCTSGGFAPLPRRMWVETQDTDCVSTGSDRGRQVRPRRRQMSRLRFARRDKRSGCQNICLDTAISVEEPIKGSLANLRNGLCDKFCELARGEHPIIQLITLIHSEDFLRAEIKRSHIDADTLNDAMLPGMRLWSRVRQS